MTIVDYVCQLIGKPYIWAGNNARGFDCSGLVIECLQAFDLLPAGDWTADALAAKLQKDGWKKVEVGQAGDVVFFHDGAKYSHTAIMINDFQYIEAGGGGAKCTSPDNSTGMVRIRHNAWRKPSLILHK